jgi:hypothetical protein
MACRIGWRLASTVVEQSVSALASGVVKLLVVTALKTA